MKYEKFEEWMVGKTVLEDGDKGVVTREYEGEGNCVWVEWESPGMGEAWIEVESLEFLNVSSQQDAVDQPVPSGHTPIPWEVGQEVFCCVFGKGKIIEIYESGPYPVRVNFECGATDEGYTMGGQLYLACVNRSLFFSEPVITAELYPPKKPFVPTLKKGDEVVTWFEDDSKYFTVVREETLTAVIDDNGDSFLKSETRFLKVGEEIKWEN